MDLGKNNQVFLDREEPRSSEAMPFGTSEFLIKALAGAGVGTWQFDAVSGLMSWDATTAGIFGLAPVPGHGRGFKIHEDDRDMVNTSINACMLHGTPHDVECRGVRADGEVRWLHAKATPIDSRTGPRRYIAGILTDITDRRLAEETTRDAEQRYRLISQTTMDLVYEWDIGADRLIWNEALGSQFGHAPEALQSIGALTAMIHPDDLDFVLAKITDVLESDANQFCVEHRLRRADGAYADVYSCGHLLRHRTGAPSRIVGSVQDLTQRKLTDAALRQSEAVNRSIVEAVTECVMLIDMDGRLEFINGPGARVVGIKDPQRLYGRDWASFWPREVRPTVSEAFSRAKQGFSSEFSEGTPTLLGEVKWWDVVVSPVMSDGKPTKVVAIARDVTGRREAKERLVQAATRDALTGLTNRATFQKSLNDAVCRSQKDGSRLGLLLFDLDNFKQVNDTLGHDAGDALLQTVAQRLGQVAPDRTLLARLGGDEFAVLVEGIADAAGLEALASAILLQLCAPLVHQERTLDWGATIGISVFPDHGATPDQLLKSADIALYVAKSRSRGGYVVFEQSYRADIEKRQSMIALARAAVRDDHILPYYQPKIDLVERSIAGVEALLRRREPGRAIQPPSTIAPAFEDLEVAAAISDKMLDHVVRDMRDWLDRDLPFDHVAVNAGAAELRRPDFAEGLLERLERAAVPSQYLHLEVTETVFLGREAESVDSALNTLSAAGIRVALDDFGTGYASLTHLRHFPVDVIKIDRSFVRQMDVNPDDEAIVRALLDLGRNLGIGVVAEGVETREQEQRLLAMGCRLVQGFLYSEAIPAGSLADILSDAARRNLLVSHP